MESRRLVLLRHAKSSWADAGLADIDRPLSSRGRRAATLVGRYIRDHRIRPQLVLCSSAARTRQTLERLRIDPDAAVAVEDELYGAGAQELLGRLRRITATVGTVLLIGHNPGIHDLAISLAGDPSRLGSFPTAGLADLDIPTGTWDQLGPGKAALHAFVIPRMLG
jgi:phosphohistidine phosphatase